MLDSTTSSSRSRLGFPSPYVHRRQPRPDPVQRPALRVRPGFAAAHGAPRRSRSSPTRGARRAVRARTSSAAMWTAASVVALRGHAPTISLSVTLTRRDFDALRVAYRAMKRLLLACRRWRCSFSPTPARAEEQLLTLYSPPIDSEPFVHKSTTCPLQARRRAGARRAGLRARLPGAGAGGLQGPGRQAAAGDQDDGPPLPLLHAGTGGSRPGRLPRRRLPERARRGAPGRAVRRRSGRPSSARATACTTPTPDGQAPAWTLTAMVMNHYKQTKRFYVRTRIWYTTEPRTQVYPVIVGDCAHLGNGMAYDVPGGGKPGSEFVDRSTLDGAVRRAHPRRARRTTTAARLHQTLLERHVLAHADGREGLLRRARSPLQHDPPDPARAGADRQRHVPLGAGDPGRGGRGARARRRTTPTPSCTSPRWASGSCSWSATTA